MGKFDPHYEAVIILRFLHSDILNHGVEFYHSRGNASNFIERLKIEYLNFIFITKKGLSFFNFIFLPEKLLMF